MRRFSNSKATDPDPTLFDRADPSRLEGDPIDRGADAIGALRPFGSTIPEPSVIAPVTEGATAVEQAMAEAAELARLGRRLDAIQRLRLVVRDVPTALAPRVKLADLLTVGDDLGEAATQLTAAILLGPTRAEDLVARGALYARMNQSVEAEQDFREAIIRDVKHFTAYRYLGQTLVKRGLLGDGIRVLREAVSLAPQDPEALLYLGEALATQGQLDDALQALELASDLRPTDPRSFMLRGRIFDRLGRTGEAMEMHRKAREVQTA